MSYTISDLKARSVGRKRSFGSKSGAARDLIRDEQETLHLYTRYVRANDGLHTAGAAAALTAYNAWSAAASTRRDGAAAAERTEADA